MTLFSTLLRLFSPPRAPKRVRPVKIARNAGQPRARGCVAIRGLGEGHGR